LEQSLDDHLTEKGKLEQSLDDPLTEKESEFTSGYLNFTATGD
jgi:hypothetical protein